MYLFIKCCDILFYSLNIVLLIIGIVVLNNNPIFKTCGIFGNYVFTTIITCIMNHVILIAVNFHKKMYKNEYCFICFNFIILYNCISTNLIYYANDCANDCTTYRHIFDFLFIESIFYNGAALYLLITIIYMFYYVCKSEIDNYTEKNQI